MFKFLDTVQVSQFSKSIKTSELSKSGRGYNTVRRAIKVRNEKPDTLYRVIAKTTFREGVIDYDADFITFIHEQAVQVYIVADRLSRRYYAVAEDMTLCAKGVDVDA